MGSIVARQGGFRLEIDAGGSPDVDQFLEREWMRWHELVGHDPAWDWSSRSIRIVARDPTDSVVGVASARIGAGVGHLSELMVGEGQRGLGLGSVLLQQFEEYCIASGCHKLTVHTDAGSPAERFYRQRGWQQEAIFRRDRGGRDFVRLYKYTGV